MHKGYQVVVINTKTGRIVQGLVPYSNGFAAIGIAKVAAMDTRRPFIAGVYFQDKCIYGAGDLN